MPQPGSVNQIDPSECATTSLGAFSRLPPRLSIRTVTVPSYSVRGTRRVRCSQVTRRPCRSRVLPLALFDGLRKMPTPPVSSSHFMMRLLDTSLNTSMRMSPNQTGPSAQWKPVATRSTVLSDLGAACRECPQRIGSQAPVLSDQECHPILGFF